MNISKQYLVELSYKTNFIKEFRNKNYKPELLFESQEIIT